jgi:hypothetical protein
VGKWTDRARRWTGALRGNPGPLGLRRIVEQGHAFEPALLDAPDDVYLDGYWQSEKYFKDAEPVLRSQLRFVPPPAPGIREWIPQLQRGEAVAIHVRRGDYVTSRVNRYVHGILPIEYYRAAVTELAQRASRPRFFVFSDDPGWCEAHLRLPYTFTVIRGSPGGSHEHLRLMSLCRHYIIANSSFSWWGAWLGSAPPGIVIAPCRWFRGASVDTPDLVPAHWIRI